MTDGHTIPGTKPFHHFIPEDGPIIIYKRFSSVHTTKKFNISCQEASSYAESSIKTMEYVACIYNCFWWVGFILETDTAQSDLKIQPHKPANFLS